MKKYKEILVGFFLLVVPLHIWSMVTTYADVSLRECVATEMVTLETFIDQNFDEISLEKLLIGLKDLHIWDFIDGDVLYKQDEEPVSEISTALLSLLELIRKSELLYVLENSEARTSGAGQRIRIKLSLLSKLKLQEIRYQLMKEGNFLRLKDAPLVESSKVYELKNSVVYWDLDQESNRDEAIKFVLLIKNKLQELLIESCALAKRVEVFRVNARHVKQSQMKENVQIKKDAKARILANFRLLSQKTLEFLNITATSNIDTVITRFRALEKLRKPGAAEGKDETFVMNAKEALYRSLSPIADVVSCLKAYNKLKYTAIARLSFDVVHYVFFECMDKFNKPLVADALMLCKEDIKLEQAFKDLLHDYVIESFNQSHLYSVKGRAWELVVAIFLIQRGAKNQKIGPLKGINEHVKLQGKTFSREFDMVSSKLLCECKNIDWSRLEERKNKLDDQFRDQAKIVKSKSPTVTFLVISRQPVSDEYRQFFKDNGMSFVDPLDPGDFAELYNDPVYNFAE